MGYCRWGKTSRCIILRRGIGREKGHGSASREGGCDGYVVIIEWAKTGVVIPAGHRIYRGELGERRFDQAEARIHAKERIANSLTICRVYFPPVPREARALTG